MTTSAPGPAGVAAVTTNFVDLSDAINPPPLNGPFFIAYRAASSIMYSALADGAALAVRARFPSVAPSDAFPYLGQDRTVYNGFAEPIASYSLRLQQWLDLLAYEGLPTGMMCALLGYCIPATWTALSPGTSCLVRTVDDSSNWNSYAAGANPVPLGALNNPFPVSVPISSVVNNAGLFEIVTSGNIQFPTGTTVSILGVVGTGGMTAAINTTWVVTVLDPTHFTLQSSRFVGSYSSGGTVGAPIIGYPSGFVMLQSPKYQNGLGNWQWDSASEPYGHAIPRWWRLWPILYMNSPGPLDGLQWILPGLSVNTQGSEGPTKLNCALTDVTTVTLGGNPATTYQVQLHLQGVVEQKTYTGSSSGGATGTNAAYFILGGTPAGDGWNVYSLTVSNPPATYYLNSGTSGNTFCNEIDYVVTIPINGGATVTLEVNSIDSIEIANNADGTGGSPISVPGVTTPAQPFFGQFVNITQGAGLGNQPFNAPTATWAPATGAITTVVTPASGATPSYYSGAGGSGTSSTEFNWDDGTCWDWSGDGPGVTYAEAYAEASALTAIAKQYKAANVWVPYVIVCYDSNYFNPSYSFGSQWLPDGTWGSWAKVIPQTASGASGIPSYYTASRFLNNVCSYLAGSGENGFGWVGTALVYTPLYTTINVVP